MQVMSDAITVLGSRHGLFAEPYRRGVSLIRGQEHPGIPAELIAGMTVDGRTRVFPLAGEGELFAFLDQDIAPTSMTFTGIDPQSRLKVELIITCPFRPRDAAFSTAPVLDLTMRVSRRESDFRWTPAKAITDGGEIFLELACGAFTDIQTRDGELRWQLKTGLARRPEPIAATGHDALVVHAGQLRGRRIIAPFPAGETVDAEIHASWCSYSEPMLAVHGEPAPFKYAERFADLDAVVDWVRDEPDALCRNAATVDGIFAANNLSRSINNLTAMTIHSWLVNTWWTTPGGEDLFSVWEGSCYYHSTVDVEYTQTPFYMTVWPELLGLQLDAWPRFTIDGAEILGDDAAGTVVFMHDFGVGCEVDTTRYNHPMPVEENANYVLMSYAYWKRTGDMSRIRRHAATIERALEFIVRCDTTGNGVPDVGMANTIDDASPAVQFGKEQIYLAVKALAALDIGAQMLHRIGRLEPCEQFGRQAQKIARVIDEKGWSDDHFATLLDASAAGVTDAWSGAELQGDTVPGWDAAHIYTANGLALLDMIGRSVGIDEDRLRTDLIIATDRCLAKNGCLHSDYTPALDELAVGEGGTVHAVRIGWISMNMLRDISAFYRGVDLRALADRYWEYQVTVNSQGAHLFFETFGGNNLMNYPRGVAVAGYFDAVAGARLDMVRKTLTLAPLDDQVRVPLLLLADWKTGEVPVVTNGALADPAGLVERAGLTVK